MTVPYTIQLVTSDPDGVEKILLETFCEIHQIYNNWNPESEISKLNSLPAHIRVPLSLELEHFLKEVGQLVNLTEGRFDPALGQGWEAIHAQNGLFWKDKAIMLDLCAVSKGYAVDLLVERLKGAGYKDLFVEWGGEIKVAGFHPDSRPWRIKILYGPIIELENVAIATSGSYFQQWEENEKFYTHIIDPISRSSLCITNQSITSASVVDKSCMRADAIATSLMLFPSKSSAQNWCEDHAIRSFVN